MISLWKELRKFGLDYDDFPSIMENIFFLLRMLTINIDKNNTQRLNIIFYIVTMISGLSYFYVYVVSLFWLVFFRYGKSEKLEVMALVICLSSCSITCITKFVFMKTHIKGMKKIVDHYLKCNAHVLPDTRFAKNLRKNLRVVKRRAIGIWIFLVMDALIYIMIPFVTPGRNFTVDKYLIYGLEPMLESPNYEIAQSIITLGITFGAFNMAGVFAYVIVIVGYNESQLRALSEELRNLWKDSLSFCDNIKHSTTNKIDEVIKEQIMNEFIKIRLRDIIKIHVTNINLLKKVDYSFRPTLALEFSLMAFSIIVELLGGLRKTYIQFPFTLVQIFMNCLIGQRLIDACEDFQEALYFCKWENFNTTNRRTIFLMLIMSQKTLTLTAGGVTVLDFICLMNILKSTYSVYTTLESALKA